MTMALATRAADVPKVFADRFNGGDLAAVGEVYETCAVMGDEHGTGVDGEGLLSVLRGHMALGLPIAVTPRKVFEADGIALLIVDWAVGDIRGTATDVARRGPDGHWRYLIDNPFGAA